MDIAERHGVRPPEYGSPANPRHVHHGTNAIFGALLVVTAIFATLAVVDDGATPAQPSAVALTPASALPVIQAIEGANWTHAPAVPPAIERTGQARVVVEWTADEFVTRLDPANDVRYAAWGFEGSTPGPILRARVGDLIEVRLTNAIGSSHPHNIDFHFVNGPGGGAPALSVTPGQTASVEVRALAPGVFMYHCATPDIPTHIANGMYGYVIIEPEAGLPQVDEEFYVVQSEFYVRGKGIASLDIDRLDREEPNYVVLNGAVGSLMGESAPTVAVGDRVRIWYGNAGPQLVSSFHVIGEIFDRVYREGDLVSPPGVGVQTTLVPAGGATAVEFTVDVPGTYLLVDHAIARAIHKGAVGAIVAEGAENAEIFAPGADNGAPPPGDDGHGGTSTVTVTISLGAYDQDNAANAYEPSIIRLQAGQSVTWSNSDEVAHTATADDGTFDTGFIEADGTSTVTFDDPGTYPYFCTPHPWMKGTVVVS